MCRRAKPDLRNFGSKRRKPHRLRMPPGLAESLSTFHVGQMPFIQGIALDHFPDARRPHDHPRRQVFQDQHLRQFQHPRLRDCFRNFEIVRCHPQPVFILHSALITLHFQPAALKQQLAFRQLLTGIDVESLPIRLVGRQRNSIGLIPRRINSAYVADA